MDQVWIKLIYIHTLREQVLQLRRLDGCTLRSRKAAVRQSCLIAALPIVSPSLCLLSRFLANNAISWTSSVLSSICRDGEL